MSGPINEALFANAAKLKETYSAGKPYPFGVLDNVCPPKFLEAVREELLELPFDAKETDLYRLRQSPDFGNLIKEARKDAKLQKKLGKVLQLCDALYSKRFRDFISEVAQCGPLTDKIDMAAAVYTNGSHLLLHDDVIDTRRISFIIYLTDTDSEEWTAEDGGCLELFGNKDGGVAGRMPQSVQGARVLPTFNRIGMFTVEAGVSFHAVQEVFAMEKDRLSIQGWFHAPEAPAANSAVPLKQLKMCSEPFIGKLEKINVPCAVKDGECELTESTVKYLQTLGVNPMYFDGNNLSQLAAQFEENGMVRLGQFIADMLVDPLQDALRQVDAADQVGLGQPTPPNEMAGVDHNWSIAGPAHFRRHLELAADVMDAPPQKSKKGDKKRESDEVREARSELANMTEAIRDRLINSDALAALISAITGATLKKGFQGRYAAARRFRPGLDYTLASAPYEKPIIEVIYTVCNGIAGGDDDEEDEDEEEPVILEEGEEDDEAGFWESCEVGGFDCLIRVEAEQTAGAVMGSGDEDAVQRLPCESNCLNIVLRNPDTLRFTKYVQSAAPSSRLDVLSVLEIEA